MEGERTFPFMRLPKEVRLVIYEFLPGSTRHLHLPIVGDIDAPSNSNENAIYTIFVVRSLPVQILQVSKTIHNEARPILKKRLDKLAQTPPLIITTANLPSLRTGVSHQEFEDDRVIASSTRGIFTFFLFLALRTVELTNSHGYVRDPLDALGHGYPTVSMTHFSCSMKHGDLGESPSLRRLATNFVRHAAKYSEWLISTGQAVKVETRLVYNHANATAEPVYFIVVAVNQKRSVDQGRLVFKGTFKSNIPPRWVTAYHLTRVESGDPEEMIDVDEIF
ncbi:hypothetical protein DM02DRAFT_698923 [Periconia macrospinosa]|uniref:F-box domain-containing protein n=1 Tax=Periconia macrospinosa TaxID=97972 RepID=A0A2V1DY58_9PLEO|nr:hypothetical protein DM02DRAFT_698923 [Periconia macrospinosa]